MSGFVCPHCGEKTDIFQSGGGKKITQETGASFLGSIPIDPKVSLDADKGLPFVIGHKDSVAAKEFAGVVEKVDEFLNKK
jgi:hypothetical protein